VVQDLIHLGQDCFVVLLSLIDVLGNIHVFKFPRG
jgi:hypothetical protein